MAGYSGTPLAQKLGIKPDMRVALVAIPDAVRDELAPALGQARVVSLAEGALHFLLAFCTTRDALVQQVEASRELLHANGALWIGWPKRSSGVATDITEDAIREVALPLGFVDNKVCAIDQIWSGLRLVVRKELRGEWPTPSV